MKVGRNFAQQARIAADDETVSEAQLRQALRDAAAIIEIAEDVRDLLAKAIQSESRNLLILIGLCSLITLLGLGAILRWAGVW